MKIGMIGLGKMGANMTRRLLRGGHQVVVFDRDEQARNQAEADGAAPSGSIAELVDKLPERKVVWMMVPAGEITESVIAEVSALLSENDILIDGGNSNYKDTIARAERSANGGIHYLDAGTSGGVWGLEVGYCLMVGGPDEPVSYVKSIFETLAPENGFNHVGPAGAGHFVKMVHNGIEYGMMQSYAEGFEILQRSKFDLNLKEIAGLWNHGSVVRSWLLELMERALTEDPELEQIVGYVNDSGEGRWTVQEAIDLDVPAMNLTHALFARFRSRQDNSFADRALAALRNQFGGHAVKTVSGASDSEKEG